MLTFIKGLLIASLPYQPLKATQTKVTIPSHKLGLNGYYYATVLGKLSPLIFK